ncbi:hypothetical protein Sliba_28680 [Streptomyces nigrescens]|uniref:Uncharacterized protein n=1 Tax=Streptomyces nigrescens TaxID=1920 RepID=A0A640TKJ6_STRNI|nr:hypothetical protein Sliba_28680 [Streptomyces libani subsp. libani]GGV90865.1 hypothetical protein GCM10010500_19500 [Streptomyces libani subsp. libani]
MKGRKRAQRTGVGGSPMSCQMVDNAPGMAIRPPENWRAGVTASARELAAAALNPECVSVAHPYPELLLRATDEAFQAFEGGLSTLTEPSDDQSWKPLSTSS